MAKINPIIPVPEGMLQPGEIILPLNPETNEGYLIDLDYFVTDQGRYFSTKHGRFEEKTLQMNSSGYLEIQVMTNVGQKHLAAHRGVLSTFNPRPDMHELQVDHMQGDHLDNRLSELQWVTTEKNNQLAKERGTTPPRTRVITDEIIHKIMHWAADGRTDKEISQMIKDQYIAPETIRMVRTGQEGYDKDLKRLGYEPILKKKHTYLTNEDYVKMRVLYESGYELKEIAKEMGISYSAVRQQICKWYGNYSARKENDKPKINPIIQMERRKKDPLSTLPNKYKGLDLHPVNVHTSQYRTLKPWYMMTDDGRVFSMARGNEWVELTPRTNAKGYMVIGLIDTEGKVASYPIHRLVMATFCPRRDMYELEVDHIHGDKTDNRLSQLRWVTHKENMIRASKEGLTAHKKQERAINDEDLKTINYMAWSGYSDQEIADHFDNKYKPSLIADARSGMPPYDKALHELGLVPYKRRTKVYSQEERDDIYGFIETRKPIVGAMKAYEEAADTFMTSAEAVRALYNVERKKRGEIE